MGTKTVGRDANFPYNLMQEYEIGIKRSLFLGGPSYVARGVPSWLSLGWTLAYISNKNQRVVKCIQL